MTSFQFLTVALLLLYVNNTAAQNEGFEGCARKRNILLRALFETGENLNELDRIFYPGEQLPSRFIEVEYTFITTTGDCTVSYFWAAGGFLLIQPPKIFHFTSLLFSYPANDLEKLKLTLPKECADLINVTNGNCECREGEKEDSVLRRLTQQVCLYQLHIKCIECTYVHDIFISIATEQVGYSAQANCIHSPPLHNIVVSENTLSSDGRIFFTNFA